MPTWQLANQSPSYIVSPLVKGTSTFAETFMKSDAIWHRLTKHLKDYNMYTAQSIHSSRMLSASNKQCIIDE